MHTVRRPMERCPDDDVDRGRAPLGLDEAVAHLEAGALRTGAAGRVGLELEGHLVDLAVPATRPDWPSVCAVMDALPPMPAASAVTVEPGGQVELSTVPAAGPADAVDALRRDRAALRRCLADHGMGVASIGADPARPSTRVNPAARYAAMEDYFDDAGHGRTGRAMMCSTASLQVNLEAGDDARQWAHRVSQVHRLGPVLVAASACSPALDGVVTGWRSSRQQVWGTLDPGRCGPLRGGDDPAAEWADYALCAPVMLVHPHAGPGGTPDAPAVPMRTPVPFRSWVAGDVQLADRRPTLADLDYHLTTLFPPVRLRGFLEIRYLDAVPDRWWPGLAAITTLLLDDPVAADAAAEASEPVATAWTEAARDGLSDPRLARAARACLRAAVDAAPASLRADVEAYAELVESGRSPGDDVSDALCRTGAVQVLREVAHA